MIFWAHRSRLQLCLSAVQKFQLPLHGKRKTFHCLIRGRSAISVITLSSSGSSEKNGDAVNFSKPLFQEPCLIWVSVLQFCKDKSSSETRLLCSQDRLHRQKIWNDFKPKGKCCLRTGRFCMGYSLSSTTDTTKATADADEPQGHFSKGALVEVVPADGNGILSSGTQNIVRNTVESRSICTLPRKNFRCREGRLLPPFQNPQFQMTICPLWDHMVYVSQFLVPSTKKSQPLRSFDSGQ